jgi:conjugal transfer pilus assembly protein TraW
VAIDRAVVDASGRVLYPAGTRVNPLMYGGLSHRYIFIDARELAQVDFALGEVKARPGDAIILVAGDWVSVSKRLGSQAYYDQGGAMTRRFQLSKTPSIVSQDGLRLKIEEFAVGGEK